MADVVLAPPPMGPVPAPERRGALIERLAPVRIRPAIPWARASGRGYAIALIVTAVLAVLGIGSLVSLLVSGGVARDWGYAAAALVFILSTLQAMPALALLSRQVTAYWGFPLRRAADLGAVTGIVSAPLTIVLLFQLPDFTGRDGIWLNWPGSPRLWDSVAVVLLALLGLVLVYVNALPDLRDRDSRLPVFRFRGGARQWSVQRASLAILGTLYLLLFVFVHLLLASDLADSLVPGWSSAVLAPYQAATALEGGLASIVLVMALVRWWGGGREVVRPDTFQSAGKLVLTMALFWFYFTYCEFLTDWFGRTPEELNVLNLMYVGPYLTLFVVAGALACVVPVVLMILNAVRGSVLGPVIASVCILVGLLADRIRLYVAAWSVAGPPSVHSLGVIPPTQWPDVRDVLMVLGLPAAALCVYLLAMRLVPIMSGWELSARSLLQGTVAYGRRTAIVLAKPPHDPGPAPNQHLAFPASKLNQDILWFPTHLPRVFWYVTAVLGLLVFAAAVSIGVLITFGLQVAGYQDTIYWAVFITNFVFWIEISHAGVLMSSMLRLSKAQWRRPITRLAEVMAIFGLMTAGLFPIIHTGRVWRTLYWIFPYDFSRTLWPNVRSPLVWDPSAIVTYLVATILFVTLGLIPDIAALRDRATGWRRTVLSLLAMGFRGTARQWRIQHTASQLMSALILPVFVSVTSIVAWDFSMAVLPGWHSTAYAPYFVIGAVHSGIAAVVTGMALLRRPLRLKDYWTPELFNTIGRLELAVLLGFFFFEVTDFYYGLASHDPVEYAIWQLRLQQPPNDVLYYIHIALSFVLPFFIWTSSKRRRNINLMLWTAIGVNIGEWLSHYLGVVNPEDLKQAFTFLWVQVYQPTPIEYLITFGALAGVGLGVFLFAKLFPIVPLHPQKEGQVLKQEVRMGLLDVPAAVHED